MSVPFVVLVRDPSNQTFSWVPVIAPTADHAISLAARNFEENGRADIMMVGAFTRDQVMSSAALFDQMDAIIQQNT